MSIRVHLDMGFLVDRFKGEKRYVNRAVNQALEKSIVPLRRAVKRQAPKRSGHLARSLQVVLVRGKGGKAEASKLLINIRPGSEAENYWLVREFGPRGGVIRGRPVLAFAFPGSPLFGKKVTASQVRENPNAYGFDYTMRFQNVVYGVRRKTGKTWEQLYPGAKRRFRAPKTKMRAPPVSKWFVPLFIVEREVHQGGAGYMSAAIDSEAPKVMARMQRAIVNRFSK